MKELIEQKNLNKHSENLIHQEKEQTDVLIRSLEQELFGINKKNREDSRMIHELENNSKILKTENSFMKNEISGKILFFKKKLIQKHYNILRYLI